MVTLDQLLAICGTLLLSVVGYFISRELAKIDEKFGELAEGVRELTKEFYSLEARLSVAEERIKDD